MSIYRPAIFTEPYIESKNILSLCLEKYYILGSNISNYITSFLKEYACGFALFNYKNYVIKYRENNIMETIVREHFIGHPFEVFIRILSKMGKNSSNKKFNKILKKINNIPNYQQIDLTKYINFIINKSNRLLTDLIQPPHFSLWLYLIDQDIAKLSINKYCKTIRYNKINDEYIKINEFRSLRLKYYINEKTDKLEEYIIHNSYLTPSKENNTQIICFYEKHLIENDDIMYLDLNRYGFTFIMDKPIKFIYNKVKIPYILDLPESVFENSEKNLYELISVVIFDDNQNKYSSIIKQGDKYYHYLYDKIIECDDQYFDEKTFYNAIGLFYRNYSG